MPTDLDSVLGWEICGAVDTYPYMTLMDLPPLFGYEMSYEHKL